jgi:hypothetical protein
MIRLWRPLLFVAVTAMAGCVSRPPSIAHVHIGHAVTGVHVTPEHRGYIDVAEERAAQALAAAQAAVAAPQLPELQRQIVAVLAATDSPQDFGLRQSLVMAANHVSFAATSEDASANVIHTAPVFASDVAVVVGRCDYIGLLAKDVAAASTLKEASLLSAEILKLARANVEGEDSDHDGTVGTRPEELGVRQLHEELRAMIAREKPAYRTVDQWYLFNLVRLPNGRWVFDKLGRGGNIDGYK